MNKFFILFALIVMITCVSARPDILGIEEIPVKGEQIGEYQIENINSSTAPNRISPNKVYKAFNADISELEGQINVKIELNQSKLDKNNISKEDLLVFYGDNLQLSGVYRESASFSVIVDKPGKYYVIMPQENVFQSKYRSGFECKVMLNPPNQYEPVENCESDINLRVISAGLILLAVLLISYKFGPVIRRKYLNYKIGRLTREVKKSRATDQELLGALMKANQHALNDNYSKANQKLKNVKKRLQNKS